MTAKKAPRHAAAQNEAGLRLYEAWDIDGAIAAFKEASTADPGNPEYPLNLARAYARGSDYQQAMHALGDYLRAETDEKVAGRYERLFSSALDEVEPLLIETMQQLNRPIQQIGKAIQMWLEYRITLGRQPLHIPKPELWAAALTYAIVKVNFDDLRSAQIAAAYNVAVRSLKDKYQELVRVLDLMPADYRYFVGEKNPLDKLVEAAQLLEELDRRFQSDD
jgi:tetratricopeptide (TPR) repeat protein